MKFNSRFNELFKIVMEEVLNSNTLNKSTQIFESGRMIPDAVKIKRENVTPTIKKIDEDIFSKLRNN